MGVCTFFDKKSRHTFMKIAPHFYENRDTLLWFVREVSGYGIAALFAKRVAIWQMSCIFTAKGTLQDGTLRCGHRSAALLVGEKRHECHFIFKCRCVAFFLMRTVCTIHVHYTDTMWSRSYSTDQMQGIMQTHSSLQVNKFIFTCKWFSKDKHTRLCS